MPEAKFKEDVMFSFFFIFYIMLRAFITKL